MHCDKFIYIPHLGDYVLKITLPIHLCKKYNGFYDQLPYDVGRVRTKQPFYLWVSSVFFVNLNSYIFIVYRGKIVSALTFNQGKNNSSTWKSQINANVFQFKQKRNKTTITTTKRNKRNKQAKKQKQKQKAKIHIM